VSEGTTTAGRPSWTFLIVVALLVLAADQATKFLAVKHLTTAFQQENALTFGEQVSAYLSKKHPAPAERHDFIPVFWSHRYAENPGAAWSFAANWPENVRIPFFHLVSLTALVLIGLYYSKLLPNQKILKVALSLVMGGAAGNLADRLQRGYVIDFIDWHLNDPEWVTRMHWPTFNVADTGISVGVALIALDTILVWWKAPRAKPATAGRAS